MIQYIIAGVVGVSLIGGVALNQNKEAVLTTILPTQEVVNVVNNKTVAATSKKKVVTNLNLSEEQVVYITDTIDEGAEKIAEEITKKSKKGKPLYLLISSPGGSVMDGALIISAIEASSVPVYTVCKNLCASMAAVIFSYGTERYMVDRSILMFHPAAGGVRGTLEEMQSLLGTITLYVNKMNYYIAQRANLTPEVFQTMWVSQLWMDAETSLQKKFSDKIVNLNVSGDGKFGLKLPENKIKEKFNIKW